jgi:NADH:ubiquinone oxidoreductase subunit E
MSEEILRKYPAGKKENLVMLLQEIAWQKGFLTAEDLEMAGCHLDIPVNKIYGVASFYDQFRFVARGTHHFQACNGTSCHLEGSATVMARLEELLQLKPGQTSRDGRFSLEAVPCFGSCANAPIVAVDGKYYTKVTAGDLKKIIGSLKDKKISHGH